MNRYRLSATPGLRPDIEPRGRMRFATLLSLILVATLLTGCRTIGYYAHLTKGQLAVLARRQPIERVVASPDTDPALRAQLLELGEAREFAFATLGMPRSRSYTRYVELPGPYVTWNVFATPEFSVDALTYCYPVAGCVAYRGYFAPDQARSAAERLHSKGYETYIGGAAAYSTLGWFADPVLSSMVGADANDTVGMLFHELAHQWLYVRDDTAFNESLASFVEQQGLAAWRQSRDEPAPERSRDEHARAFTRRVLELRDTLARIYRQPITHESMRTEREAAIEAFREWHAAARRTRWPGDARYDRWVAGPINNAKLVPFGLYDGWVAAFEAMFNQVDGDWARFRAAVEVLATLPRKDRDAALEALIHLP